MSVKNTFEGESSGFFDDDYIPFKAKTEQSRANPVSVEQPTPPVEEIKSYSEATDHDCLEKQNAMAARKNNNPQRALSSPRMTRETRTRKTMQLFPPSLYEQGKQMAFAEGISFNELINRLLEMYVDGKIKI